MSHVCHCKFPAIHGRQREAGKTTDATPHLTGHRANLLTSSRSGIFETNPGVVPLPHHATNARQRGACAGYWKMQW